MLFSCWKIIKTIGKVTIGSIFFIDHVGIVTLVSGPSMEPELMEGDIVIGRKIFYDYSGIRRNDVVTFAATDNPRERIVKRITGLPGDFKYIGPYMIQVPRGHVFVEGDNLNNSRDSRRYGPIPMALVKSRITIRIYPFHRFKIF